MYVQMLHAQTCVEELQMLILGALVIRVIVAHTHHRQSVLCCGAEFRRVNEVSCGLNVALQVVEVPDKVGMGGAVVEQGQTRPPRSHHSRAFRLVDVDGRTVKCGRGLRNNSKSVETDTRHLKREAFFLGREHSVKVALLTHAGRVAEKVTPVQHPEHTWVLEWLERYAGSGLAHVALQYNHLFTLARCCQQEHEY